MKRILTTHNLPNLKTQRKKTELLVLKRETAKEKELLSTTILPLSIFMAKQFADATTSTKERV
jgi:hypothetical protein